MRTMVVWLVLAMLGSPSYAATISNLGEVADTVDVWDANGYTPTVIEPKRSIDFSGDVKVRYAGMEKRIKNREEFVIWGNGHFLVQSSRK